MFGKLTLSAIPFDQPIIMGAGALMAATYGKLTGGAASPLLPPNHRTMRGRPDTPLRGSSALAVMRR